MAMAHDHGPSYTGHPGLLVSNACLHIPSLADTKILSAMIVIPAIPYGWVLVSLRARGPPQSGKVEQVLADGD